MSGVIQTITNPKALANTLNEIAMGEGAYRQFDSAEAITALKALGFIHWTDRSDYAVLTETGQVFWGNLPDERPTPGGEGE